MGRQPLLMMLMLPLLMMMQLPLLLEVIVGLRVKHALLLGERHLRQDVVHGILAEAAGISAAALGGRSDDFPQLSRAYLHLAYRLDADAGSNEATRAHLLVVRGVAR